MNYYEHHLGDYLRDTAHLSMLEDGAYRRLIDAYYIREAPLQAELRDVFRLVRAQSKQDREAVETVLREFFIESPDGWRHSRCDREVAAYAETIPDRESRRENDRERQRRARERRRDLFERLRTLDIVPAYDTKTSDLESMLSRAQSRDASRDVTPPVTRDNTATQTPDTRHQTPSTNVSSAAASATAKRGQRLSPDWVLPKAWGDWALTEYPHWTEETVRLIARKFRDHWAPKTGKDATKLDWLATWRNWCSSGITQKEHPPPHAMNGHAMTFKERDTENARTKLDRLTGGRATAPRTPKPVDPFLQLQGLDDDTPRLPGA